MKRFALPLAALTVATVLFAGCSKTDTVATSPTTQASAQSSSGGNTTTSKSGSSDSGSSSSSGKSSDKTTTTLDKTGIPSLDKTMDQANNCLNMAMAYAGLYLPLLTNSSAEDKAKVKSALDDMKDKVPDKIKKDLETIENGLNDANSLQDLSTFMDSDQFKTADKEINDYLTNECDKIGK